MIGDNGPARSKRAAPYLRRSFWKASSVVVLRVCTKSRREAFLRSRLRDGIFTFHRLRRLTATIEAFARARLQRAAP